MLYVKEGRYLHEITKYIGLLILIVCCQLGGTY